MARIILHVRPEKLIIPRLTNRVTKPRSTKPRTKTPTEAPTKPSTKTPPKETKKAAEEAAMKSTQNAPTCANLDRALTPKIHKCEPEDINRIVPWTDHLSFPVVCAFHAPPCTCAGRRPPECGDPYVTEPKVIEFEDSWTAGWRSKGSGKLKGSDPLKRTVLEDWGRKMFGAVGWGVEVRRDAVEEGEYGVGGSDGAAMGQIDPDRAFVGEGNGKGKMGDKALKRMREEVNEGEEMSEAKRTCEDILARRGVPVVEAKRAKRKRADVDEGEETGGKKRKR